MASNFKRYYVKSCVVLFFIVLVEGAVAQDTSTIKAQIALGVNGPSQEDFVPGFEGQQLNFPTVNLGLQYMFKPRLGAKLDYGFNRISHQDGTQEFKVNYSRVNAQFVYDASRVFGFLGARMGTFVHAGPGLSLIKPLGNYTENDTSYLNIMAGIELHYGISDAFSLYLDGSYINGFSSDFDPLSDGYGSFNGNLWTLTLGVSISLSGCYYCD